MKICVIGGVAGGAGFAARMRRLDENAQIIIFERGEFVSFANCGLPYHISGAISDRDDLILKTPDDFKRNYNIDVRTRHEVLSLNKENKTLSVKNLDTGNIQIESFDKLVLSPGASPFIPPMEGYHPQDVLTLRNIPDMDKILSTLTERNVQSAIIMGGGFIGLELAENLKEKNIHVDLIEFADQVMIPFDKEMASLLHGELINKGIRLHLQDAVSKIEKLSKNHLRVTLKSGKILETQILISAIGVRPESHLAKVAGLSLGEKEAIVVNEHMQTNHPDIYAIGDAIEVRHFLTHEKTLLPLASPAAKQARIVANHIKGLEERVHEVQGTAIVKVFNLTAAVTGLGEKTLKKLNIPFEALRLHPFHHVTYYPGAKQLCLKIFYHKKDLTLLGAQAIGAEGVDKRIDVLATAIRQKMKVTELQDLELCYAPPYGLSKDPIHMAGFIAENIKAGLVEFVSSEDMGKYPNAYFLDVRTPEEFVCGHIPGAINIPLYELRERLNEIPRDRTIVVNCAVAIRAYNAIRVLSQHGFKNLLNLSGGYKSYVLQKGLLPQVPKKESPIGSFDAELRCEGMQCPGPIVALKKKMDTLAEGQKLKILVSDPGFLKDVPAFCASTGHKLLEVHDDQKLFWAIVEKKGQTQILAPKQSEGNKKTIVVFSGDLDKALATFIIANGAKSMGSDVTLFFTFWGLNILRDHNKMVFGKELLDSLFGFMMPKGPSKLKLSKMNMLGMGTLMMKYVMNKKKVDSLESLIQTARETGIHLVACSMSMDVMGIKKEELIEGVEIAGVAHYLNTAEQSNLNLFI